MSGKAFQVIGAMVLTLAATRAYPADPAEALQRAKSLIAAKRFGDAVSLLAPALRQAESFKDADTREQAVSALHFYLAVAHFGSGDQKNAREHLENFFQLTPKARGIDRTKFDPGFVALFNELSPLAKETTAIPFSALYPSVSSINVREPEAPPEAWLKSLALEILGSHAEKDQWRDLVGTEERIRFIEAFWERRDPTRGTTANEFREQFFQRVSYADEVFGVLGVRGALTDPGRVFVLLGEPWAVRRRPLRRWDRVFVAINVDDAFETQYRTGKVEQWFYKREQLPMPLAKDMIGYRFVTHPTVGDHVLQKNDDPYATQALIVATNPNGRAQHQ